MPTMTINPGFFENHHDVMQDIAKTGYWPTTYVSGLSPELPVHRHDYDIIGYVLKGAGYLLDESQQRIDIRAGDRLNIPKGALHAEGAVTEEIVYIVTVNEPVGLTRALQPRDLKGPMPDLSGISARI